MVHDPLYTDEELVGFGFMVYHLGDVCDAAILQAEHQQYHTLTPADLGGATVVIDGRRCVSAHPDLTIINIGDGSRRP
jgi:hypothetical protein